MTDEQPRNDPDPPTTPPQSNWVARGIQQFKRYFHDRRTAKKQESSQDRAARRTANATVAVAFLTVAVVAIGGLQYLIFKAQLKVMADQVDEMRGTGKQTDELISANKSLAEAANGQLETMRGQLEELKASRKQTDDAIAASNRIADASNEANKLNKLTAIASSRAWVGPTYAAVINMKAGEPIKVDIAYGNTGREPAPMNHATDPKVFDRTAWNGGAAVQDILKWEVDCMNSPINELAATIAFPTTGQSFLVAHFDSANENVPENLKFKASEQLIAGDEFFVIKGCFTYKTVETIHHTSFCYFYNLKTSVGGQLSICTVGHRAD